MPGKNKSIVKEYVSKSSGPVDVENRQIRFLASTADVDRDGERILPSAFENTIPDFMKNSIFLACHAHRLDSGEPPVIGKIIRAWVDAKVGLWIIVEFATSELGEKYWQLYRDNFMKAVSVGFIPIKWHEEIIEGERVRTYDEVELIEVSAVAVPSNRGALARSKQNKLAFVQEKREDRELKKFLAEARQQDPEFDAKCEEFAEILMTADLNGGEVPDRKEIDYVNLVRR
jgi:HK97 family phage prohead protease